MDSAVLSMTMKDSQREKSGVMPVTVYLPREIHREIQKAAKQGRRSMSAQIVTIVENTVHQGAGK